MFATDWQMIGDQDEAWLETTDRGTSPIRGSCSIGRSGRNTVVLDSPNVSRRHALINIQNAGEFWLIDLGSSNGTFLNNRRIHQPVRLNSGDQIAIGNNVLIFHQTPGFTDAYNTLLTQQTIRQIENVPCWLLAADIENFTPLSQQLGSDRLAVLVGGWLATCKEIIEQHHGTINKYLGDGFLAYWRHDEKSTANVSVALNQLKELQAQHETRFRLALHHGLVVIGGVPSMGEESLMGKDVNFVFRMEKLAASLGIGLLVSAPATNKLGAALQAQPAGSHQLKGFDEKQDFFRC